MYTVQPSPSRRALSLFATFRVWFFSLRPYVLFSAPGSVPPWPGSRTTFPEQGGCSCAPAPDVRAAVERTIAVRIAASTVAHTFKRPEYVILHPFRSGISAAEEAGPEAAVLQ